MHAVSYIFRDVLRRFGAGVVVRRQELVRGRHGRRVQRDTAETTARRGDSLLVRRRRVPVRLAIRGRHRLRRGHSRQHSPHRRPGTSMTSCCSNGSDGPQRRYPVDHSIVFVRWRRTNLHRHKHTARPSRLQQLAINAGRIVCDQRLCNGRLSVRLSVPSIDSRRDAQLVYGNPGAGGRYRSIPAAGARVLQRSASC